jgi:hypothetical protein
MNNPNNYMYMQDLQGMSPVFQNIQNQQQSAQQALMQGNQLAAQALGTPQQIQMANALRNNPTQQSDMQKQEINQLGSNTWNPYSDYNRGTNGWGNYGE